MHPKRGRPLSGALQSYPSELRQQIKDLRSHNEGWGAISILVELEVVYGYSKVDLPSADSIHRYLKQCGFVKAKVPKGSLVLPTPPNVETVHDLWEMDAQGAVAVTGLGYIAMINIKDVKSKTYIGAFPVQVASSKSQPKTPHYLWALRLAFEEFGLPKAIQVDKDSVFIDNTSKSPFPSVIQLFLVGLDIKLCFIQYAPPIQQAMVERSHQTLENQALRGKSYQNWNELFVNTNKRRKLLNEHYPSRSLDKQAPLQVYPKETHPERPYSLEVEKLLVSIQRIEQYLEACKWFRKVSSAKTVSLKHTYYLKNAVPGTYAQINFCAKSKQLVFRDDNQQIIDQKSVPDFVEKLIGLDPVEELKNKRKQLFESKEFPLK